MQNKAHDDVLLEVCIDNVEGLNEALQGGADRVELCSALPFCGGLSPSQGLLAKAAEIFRFCQTPVYAMIRPRCGGFFYTDAEIDVMELEIDAVRASGLPGVVFGANTQDGRLDEGTLRRLMKRAQGLGTTLHRSFDLVPDIREALGIATELGFERILTSGRATKAIPDGLQDLEMLFGLVSESGGRINIMPGSGLSASNMGALFERICGIKEVHSSCSVPVARTPIENCVRLGFEQPSAERQTNAHVVREMKQRLIMLRNANIAV